MGRRGLQFGLINDRFVEILEGLLGLSKCIQCFYGVILDKDRLLGLDGVGCIRVVQVLTKQFEADTEKRTIRLSVPEQTLGVQLRPYLERSNWSRDRSWLFSPCQRSDLVSDVQPGSEPDC